MKKFLIYSSNTCSYCLSAKSLLENLELSFQEKIIDNSDKIKQEMYKRSNGRKTVPQIFFGEFHIGGYDDLAYLHKKGELKRLLDENKL